MIPLKINHTHLCQIFEPELDIAGWSDDAIQSYSISKMMFPTSVALTSETYSRDAERTADYELEHLTLINRKTKPEFVWGLIRREYVEKLMQFLNYTYGFKNAEGYIVPVDAPTYVISYLDFTGTRTINSYLGQTIEGTLEEYEGVQYWRDFRIAFPER